MPWEGKSNDCGGGGAQIIEFTIDTVDCDAKTGTGTVTDIMCSGAEVAVGDSVDLVDTLGFLVGNPMLLMGLTGLAVKMQQNGPYGADCAYKIINLGGLETNC